MTWLCERRRAAVDIAEDALDVDVLSDDVEDAVATDDLLLLLASAADDLDLAMFCEGVEGIEPKVSEAIEDVEDLARWRARNVAQPIVADEGGADA